MASSRHSAQVRTNGANAEKRATLRNALYADVWVDTGGTACPTQYKVIDVSFGGAKLAAREGHKLPESFVIRIGGTNHTARLVWRTQKHIGVKFDKAEG